jgi:hypothetical protein
VCTTFYSVHQHTSEPLYGTDTHSIIVRRPNLLYLVDVTWYIRIYHNVKRTSNPSSVAVSTINQQQIRQVQPHPSTYARNYISHHPNLHVILYVRIPGKPNPGRASTRAYLRSPAVRTYRTCPLSANTANYSTAYHSHQLLHTYVLVPLHRTNQYCTRQSPFLKPKLKVKSINSKEHIYTAPNPSKLVVS